MNQKLITWIVIIAIIGISLYNLWRRRKKEDEHSRPKTKN